VSQVLDFAKKYIDGLKPTAGSNYIGCCPIHGEVAGKSKPSFSFNIATGQWYCFSGCGGGGLPQLLKRLNKSREYVDKAMVRLGPSLVKTERKKNILTRTGLFETPNPLPERLLGLFEFCPESLIDAGFDEYLLWEQDVGYDQKRERITFPVRDIKGRLAGISGRCESYESGGKYKVYRKEIQDLGYPNYSFDNHNYLWGWETVYPQVYGAEDPAVVLLTEGFKARLWMMQSGFPDVVASMGTNISDMQRRFFQRVGGTVIFCLDNDVWGREATLKNGYKLPGCNVLVMNYPEIGLQPDDMSHDDVIRAIETSQTYSKWRRQNVKSVRAATQRARREKAERK